MERISHGAFMAGVFLAIVAIAAFSLVGFAYDQAANELSSSVSSESDVSSSATLDASFVSSEVISDDSKSSSSTKTSRSIALSNIGSLSLDSNMTTNVTTNLTEAISISLEVPSGEEEIFQDQTAHISAHIDAPIGYLATLHQNDSLVAVKVGNVGNGSDAIYCFVYIDGNLAGCGDGITLTGYGTENRNGSEHRYYEVALDGSAFAPKHYTLSFEVRSITNSINYATQEQPFTVLSRNQTADVNGDGYANKVDVEIIKYLWGRSETGKADLDGDGVITIADVAQVILNWYE